MRRGKFLRVCRFRRFFAICPARQTQTPPPIFRSRASFPARRTLKKIANFPLRKRNPFPEVLFSPPFRRSIELLCRHAAAGKPLFRKIQFRSDCAATLSFARKSFRLKLQPAASAHSHCTPCAAQSANVYFASATPSGSFIFGSFPPLH